MSNTNAATNLRLVEGIEDYIPKHEIDARTEDLADFYRDLYGDEELVLIAVLNGASPFASNLGMGICSQYLISDTIKMSSMNGNRTTNKVTPVKRPDQDIKGKNVLIVEDIDDTRRTLVAIGELLLPFKPKRLDLVSLLNKPTAEKVITNEELGDIFDDINYGFEIENRFVVGHGLDWNQRYRLLGHITVAHNTASPGEEPFYEPIVT